MNSGITRTFVVRKLIHLITGLGFVVVTQHSVKMSIWLGIMVISAILLDVSRHFIPWWNIKFLSIFGKFLKESEKQGKLAGATSLWMGLYLSFLVFPLNIFQISTSVVVIADPLAALGGRTIPSPFIRRTKTITGSAIFIGIAVLLFTQYWNIPLIPAVFISILLAVIELYSWENVENIFLTVGGTMIVYLYFLL